MKIKNYTNKIDNMFLSEDKHIYVKALDGGKYVPIISKFTLEEAKETLVGKNLYWFKIGKWFPVGNLISSSSCIGALHQLDYTTDQDENGNDFSYVDISIYLPTLYGGDIYITLDSNFGDEPEQPLQ